MSEFKAWPGAFLQLPVQFRRIINNFMSSRPADLTVLAHALNWHTDCRRYDCPSTMRHYFVVARLYEACGPIDEFVRMTPEGLQAAKETIIELVNAREHAAAERFAAKISSGLDHKSAEEFAAWAHTMGIR